MRTRPSKPSHVHALDIYNGEYRYKMFDRFNAYSTNAYLLSVYALDKELGD